MYNLSQWTRLDISLHHNILQRQQQEQRTDDFKLDMKHRAAIEGTISEAVRGHGLRQNRYRGLTKTRLQALMTGAAINLKRLMALLPTLFRDFMIGNLICFSTESRMSILRNPSHIVGMGSFPSTENQVFSSHSMTFCHSKLCGENICGYPLLFESVVKIWTHNNTIFGA